eukprot:gene10669-9364_t
MALTPLRAAASPDSAGWDHTVVILDRDGLPVGGPSGSLRLAMGGAVVAAVHAVPVSGGAALRVSGPAGVVT